LRNKRLLLTRENISSPPDVPGFPCPVAVTYHVSKKSYHIHHHKRNRNTGAVQGEKYICKIPLPCFPLSSEWKGLISLDILGSSSAIRIILFGCFFPGKPQPGQAGTKIFQDLIRKTLTNSRLKIIKQREGIIIRVPRQVDGKIEKQVILNDNADAKSFVVIRTKFWK